MLFDRVIKKKKKDFIAQFHMLQQIRNVFILLIIEIAKMNTIVIRNLIDKFHTSKPCQK